MKASKGKSSSPRSLRFLRYSFFKALWQVTNNELHFLQNFCYGALVNRLLFLDLLLTANRL